MDETSKSLQADALALAWRLLFAAQTEHPDLYLSVARQAVRIGEAARDRHVLTLADQAALAKVRGA